MIWSSFTFSFREAKVANANKDTLVETTIENKIKSIETKDYNIKTINTDDKTKMQNLVEKSNQGVLFQNNCKEIKADLIKDTSKFEKVEPSENIDVVNTDSNPG